VKKCHIKLSNKNNIYQLVSLHTYFLIKHNKHYCVNTGFICVCRYNAICFDPLLGHPEAMSGRSANSLTNQIIITIIIIGSSSGVCTTSFSYCNQYEFILYLVF
jgi:hypothetical protein